MDSSLLVIDDIVELILLKLPSKSLIRFKAVSKAWNDVITGEPFIKRWCSLSNNGSSSFILLRDRWEPKPYIDYFSFFSVSQDDGKVIKSDTFKLPFLDGRRTIDGALICPASLGIYCIFRFQERRIALWNPTTRELKEIPFSPFDFMQEMDVRDHGFAHAEYKEGVLSYKIGMIRQRGGKDCNVIVTIDLYSSSERSWKLLEDCYQCKRVMDDKAVYNINGWVYAGSILNGKYHWLNWNSREDTHIVTFDLSTERFGRIEIPAFIQHDFDCNPAFSLITKLDENYLCLLLYREKDDKKNIDVWTMKEYGMIESWTKTASAGPVSSDLSNVDVLGVNNSIKGLFFQSMAVGDGLFFCSFGSNKSEIVIPIDSEAHEMLLMVEYIPSVVPLNGTSDGRSHA